MRNVFPRGPAARSLSPGAVTRNPRLGSPASIRRCQVHGGAATVLLLLDLETDLLAFTQAAEASFLHRANMDKDVLAPGVGCDETVSLGGVEPLHCTVRHRRSCPFCPEAAGVAKWRADRR